MNFDSFHHEAKSNFAYMYDDKNIHIRLKVKKGVTNDVKLIFGDPFHYKAQEDTNRYAWAPFADGIKMTKDYETQHHDFFFISVHPTYLRMKYAFLIDDQFLYGSREVIDLKAYPNLRYNLFNYFNFPYLNEEDLFNPPSWVKDQVWYSIFPERFNNGDASLNKEGTLPWGSEEKVSNDQFYGGDLRGIINELDYIQDMGFTGIYMTPIFHASASHKYDTIDYFKIDPNFGTNEDFKELVEKAHAKGIKVMLDAVFNHSGLYHPFFLDVIEKGKDSKYYDSFYIIDDNKPVLPYDPQTLKTKSREEMKELFKPENINYRTFAFTPFMPKLRTMEPFMKNYLLDVSRYWIEKYDIDGWRLDVSNEIPHAFWREFRTVVKAAKSDAYIVGENWDNSNPWLHGDQYDAVMNYEILFPVWQYFGTNIDFPNYTTQEFIYRINKVLTDYPKNVLESMYNLVDSHDTSRIMHLCNNNPSIVKLAYIFLFSFAGAPSIFYGGEVGLTGDHDPDNRRCMPWDESKQDLDLKTFIKRLIEVRKQEDDLKLADINWLEANNDHVLMYQKGELLIILNNQNKTHKLDLPKHFANKTNRNVFTDETVQCDKTITLDPYAYIILK